MTYIYFNKFVLDKFQSCRQTNIRKPTGYYFYDGNTTNIELPKKFDFTQQHLLKFNITDINTIDPNKVLLIDSEADFDKLTILFGIKDLVYSDDDSIIYLNWPLVSQYFGGIIINPSIQRKLINNRKVLFNYRKNGFDVGKKVYTWLDNFENFDGCFWNSKVINLFYIKNTPLTNQTNNSSK